MDCSFCIIFLCLLLASGFTVWKGYRFSKERLKRWKVIGILMMFLGVSWPFLLCGGLKVLQDVTYRKLDFNQITKGMTGDEVRAVWGEPNRILKYASHKTIEWHYFDSALGLDGGVVTFDQEERVEGVHHLGW